jgi:hypothetical protein
MVIFSDVFGKCLAWLLAETSNIFFFVVFFVNPENCSVRFFKTVDTAELLLVNKEKLAYKIQLTILAAAMYIKAPKLRTGSLVLSAQSGGTTPVRGAKKLVIYICDKVCRGLHDIVLTLTARVDSTRICMLHVIILVAL